MNNKRNTYVVVAIIILLLVIVGVIHVYHNKKADDSMMASSTDMSATTSPTGTTATNGTKNTNTGVMASSNGKILSDAAIEKAVFVGLTYSSPNLYVSRTNKAETATAIKIVRADVNGDGYQDAFVIRKDCTTMCTRALVFVINKNAKPVISSPVNYNPGSLPADVVLSDVSFSNGILTLSFVGSTNSSVTATRQLKFQGNSFVPLN